MVHNLSHFNCIIIFIAVVIVVKVEHSLTLNCKSLYRRFDANHTACLKPNPSCQRIRTGIHKKGIDRILYYHNNYRNSIAIGNENQSYGFPTASAMLELEWDNELQTIAQAHADQCLFAHDCNQCRQTDNFSVGQNLFQRISTQKKPKPDWKAAIKSFYDEIQVTPLRVLNKFQSNKKWGHFSQVIWDKTWKIGCGYAAYETNDKDYITEELYTCNYGPAGNLDNAAIYEIGEPASKCPLNTNKSDHFDGLCKANDKTGPKIKKPPEDELLYFCDFSNGTDCGIDIVPNNYSVINTIYTGNYISSILAAGEEVSFLLNDTFRGSEGFCVIFSQRKGATNSGQLSYNNLEFELIVPELKWTTTSSVGLDWPDWANATLHVSWFYETQVNLKFSVPDDAPPQYFDMQNLYVVQGACNDN